MLNIPAMRGIYRYHEFIGPVIPLEAVVYLGEGHTPMVEANPNLQGRREPGFTSKTTVRIRAHLSKTAGWRVH